MSEGKITQADAERLLNMVKFSLTSEINFPIQGKKEEFEVRGDTKQDVFTVTICRGHINRLKYEVGARIKKHGIMLLELHINPNNVHYNPNGEKLVGSHWHIYTEEHGRKMAFAAENIESEKFVENTIAFLKRFNVIERPTINHQVEL